MALRSSVTDSWLIVTSKQVIPEKVFLAFFGGYHRTHTIVTGEWICLTYQAAETFAAAHVADTNVTYELVEVQRELGAWKLVKHVDSFSAWIKDT